MKNVLDDDLVYRPTEVRTEIQLEDCIIAISTNEYREIVTKAAALDILAAAIRKTGTINEDLIRAVTGTLDAADMVPKEEADDFWRLYMEEKKKAEELKLELAKTGKDRNELIEILRQNHIGPFAVDPGKQEGNG